MQVTITNLLTTNIYLRDLYTTLGPAGQVAAKGFPGSITFSSAKTGAAAATSVQPSTGGLALSLYGAKAAVIPQAVRSPRDIMGLGQIQTLVAAGSISVTMTLDSDELASPLVGPPDAIAASAMQEVAASKAEAPLIVLRQSFVAATAGTSDDVTIYAAAGVPFKMRILDSFAIITTAVASKTFQLWSKAGATGTQFLGTLTTSGSSAQMLRNAGVSATTVVNTTDGLFINRSDRGQAGEIVILARRET